jgi:hypothetical protein
MSARDDYAATGDSSGYTGVLPGDAYDNAQMQQFAPNQSEPWYVSMIQYGITRAIDNRFGPVNVAGNTQPGTFAGQNGRTYAQAPNGTGQTVQAPQQGMDMGLMAIVALAAFLALG